MSDFITTTKTFKLTPNLTAHVEIYTPKATAMDLKFHSGGSVRVDRGVKLHYNVKYLFYGSPTVTYVLASTFQTLAQTLIRGEQYRLLSLQVPSAGTSAVRFSLVDDSTRARKQAAEFIAEFLRQLTAAAAKDYDDLLTLADAYVESNIEQTMGMVVAMITPELKN